MRNQNVQLLSSFPAKHTCADIGEGGADYPAFLVDSTHDQHPNLHTLDHHVQDITQDEGKADFHYKNHGFSIAFSNCECGLWSLAKPMYNLDEKKIVLPPCHRKNGGFFGGLAHESGLPRAS